MRRPLRRVLRLLLACTILPLLSAMAQKGADGYPAKSGAVTTNDHRATFLINNLFNYYVNDGTGSYNPITGNSGLEFPKGTPEKRWLGAVVFEEGLIWGGFHMGRAIPKAGGSQYRHGLQAGRILVPGTPRPPGVYTPNSVSDNPSLPKYRIYRVRSEVRPRTSFEVYEKKLTEEAALISRYEPSVTVSSLAGQYLRDWDEWPARGSLTDSLGLAPFTDLNGDGRYDPSIDIPGIPGADQTLYYVANDCDSVRVYNFTGSQSMGIEMHRTIWGYAGRGVLNNVIFQSTVLINKSGAPVDSMFVGLWMDPDVGDSGDDHAACDTVLGLSYAYNGGVTDNTYGYSVPAVGSILLSGPSIPGGGSDSAIVGLRYRHGIRSLFATSAIYNDHSSVYYADPLLGPGGDIELFRLLNGFTRTGEPYYDSTTMLVTRFPFAGDPVRQTGSFMRRLSDWRTLISSGPFRFADGDTQEVVFATIAAQGPDRLSSVTALKEGAVEVRQAYLNLLAAPAASAAVTFPTQGNAQVSVRVDGRKTPLVSGKVILRRRDGSRAAEFPLADDGAHSDELANDQIFRGTIQIPAELIPLAAEIEGSNSAGGTLRFANVISAITVAGPVAVGDLEIFSDNLNNDHQADLFENLRYGFTLSNGTGFQLRDVRFHAAGDLVKSIAVFDAGAEFPLQYNPAQPSTAFSVDVIGGAGSIQGLPVSVSDSFGNRWVDTLLLPFTPSRYAPLRYQTTHVAGSAYGTLDVMLIDRRVMKDRTYLVRAQDPEIEGELPTITVEDSVNGRVVLPKTTLPDQLGHTIPQSEGFKILCGSVETPGASPGYARMSSGSNPWPATGGADGLRLETNSGTIGSGARSWPCGGATYLRLRDVEIRFADADSLWRVSNPADANVSYAHRYLAGADRPAAQPGFAPFIVNATLGYAYQAYVKNLPFAAYDVDVSPPRRLMVGFLENNVSAGLVDGRYAPPVGAAGVPPWNNNVDSLGPREWFFVFDIPYAETPAPSLQVDLLNTRTPLMWFGTPSRRADRPPSTSRVLSITVRKSPGTGDLWSFNPVALLGGIYRTIPDQLQLLPNYPNPFNAGTTIRYGLPADSRVTLRIYNILGQEVRTLVDEVQLEGYRTSQWDGRNNAGAPVATGVYIYRLQGATTDDNPREFVSSQKMIVVR